MLARLNIIINEYEACGKKWFKTDNGVKEIKKDIKQLKKDIEAYEASLKKDS
jgi:peptidoglycan hydrolase CwlO-like protein